MHMGFLSGSMSFDRFWITKDETPVLGPDHLETLEKFKIDNRQTSGLDQPVVGFLAGDHILDTQFSLEKNVIGDALHFAVRIDTTQIPAAIRKAWLQMELLPFVAENEGSKPTKAQREQAREAVEERCEQEAATGKFRRMSQISVLWDAANDVLFLGGTSENANALCLELMERAFDLEFDRITSGKLAKAYASDAKVLDDLYKVEPTPFTGGSAASVTWWNGMAENYDFLGNEFLLWLWWHYETESDTITLHDDSIVSGMFARTLTLDCPLGEFGKETISSDSPVVLPEAALALRSGKLPRKAGLMLVRDDQQCEFTLQAEEFSIGGARLSQVGDSMPLETEDRVNSLRQFVDTIDFLFEAFCRRRIGPEWAKELKQIQKWLTSDQRLAQRKPAA